MKALLTLLSLAIGTNAIAAQEVTVQTTAGTLSGTLEIPTGSGPFPVALIIAGSGPTDRDGNSVAGIETDAYKLLAQGLATKGIASLRYDKRGVGKSTVKDAREDVLRFEDFATDAATLLEYLGQDSRFNKRVIIGHSEGSLLGILAAQRLENAGAKLAGFVSIAGAGRSIDTVLLEQLKPQLTPAMLEECKRILAELKAGRTVPNPERALPAQLAASLFRPSVQPYLISWIKYDPALEITKLKAPSLIVQGTTDVQVSVQDARLLASALKSDPTLIEGMNHVLKEATGTISDRPQQRTYTDPSLPLVPKFLDAIVSFIEKL